MSIESWRTVWRHGVAPVLSTNGLKALRLALITDDARLLQGATCSPPPMQCVLDWPPEGACLIGVAGWLGDGLGTVGEVEEFFAKTCYDADQRIGEPAVVRYLLNAFDDWPRDEMRANLLPEVDRALGERLSPAEASALAGRTPAVA